MSQDSTLLIDEFRVYSRALTDDEILRSYDRMLSGNEQGIALYWPMNEGYPTGYVFDRSTTVDAPNNAHGKAVSGVSYTEDSPNQTGQVSCYGLTDKEGHGHPLHRQWHQLHHHAVEGHPRVQQLQADALYQQPFIGV